MHKKTSICSRKQIHKQWEISTTPSFPSEDARRHPAAVVLVGLVSAGYLAHIAFVVLLTDVYATYLWVQILRTCIRKRKQSTTDIYKQVHKKIDGSLTVKIVMSCGPRTWSSCWICFIVTPSNCQKASKKRSKAMKARDIHKTISTCAPSFRSIRIIILDDICLYLFCKADTAKSYCMTVFTR